MRDGIHGKQRSRLLSLLLRLVPPNPFQPKRPKIHRILRNPILRIPPLHILLLILNSKKPRRNVAHNLFFEPLRMFPTKKPEKIHSHSLIRTRTGKKRSQNEGSQTTRQYGSSTKRIQIRIQRKNQRKDPSLLHPSHNLVLRSHPRNSISKTKIQP